MTEELPNMSVVVPVFSPSEYRKRNLSYVLSLLDKFDNVLIVEQVYKESAISEIVKQHNNVVHIEVKSNSESIEKSRLINVGVILSKYDNVLINDSDIVFNFSSLLGHIGSNMFIKPFEKFMLLNEEQSLILMADRKIDVECLSIPNFGAGSFLVNKKAFVDIGGMDERYIGWGYEDLEIGARISRFHKVLELKGCGAHLWHPKQDRLDIYRRKFNRSLFEMSKTQLLENAEEYVCQLRCVLHKYLL